MDGDISAPIPVQEANRRGARRILVIRSRPAEFVKRASVLGNLSALAFHRASAFAQALRPAHHAYQGAVAFMRAPLSDCEIVQVAPPRTLATGRTTQTGGHWTKTTRSAENSARTRSAVAAGRTCACGQVRFERVIVRRRLLARPRP